MKRLILASLTSLLLCFGWSASIRSASVGVQAQVCPNRQCSLQNISDADELLNLTDTEKADAEERHLLGGRPIPSSGSTNEHMIHQHEWIT
jgi:hypothetical protein